MLARHEDVGIKQFLGAEVTGDEGSSSRVSGRLAAGPTRSRLLLPARLLRRGRLRGRRLGTSRRLLARCVRSRFLRPGEARLEGLHQVDDLRARLLRLALDNLLAGVLGLDDLAQLIGEGVVVLLGIPRRRQRIDELGGHLQLLRVGLSGAPGQVDVGLRDHLVGEAHRRHREGAVERADRCEVLLVPHDDSADGCPVALHHRGEEQRIRLGGVSPSGASQYVRS